MVRREQPGSDEGILGRELGGKRGGTRNHKEEFIVEVILSSLVETALKVGISKKGEKNEMMAKAEIEQHSYFKDLDIEAFVYFVLVPCIIVGSITR